MAVAEGGKPGGRRRGRPPLDRPKQAVSLRLEAGVIEKFKATGPGWQRRMNEVLREAVLTETKIND